MDINGLGQTPYGPMQRASYSQVVRRRPTQSASGLSSNASPPPARSAGSRTAGFLVLPQPELRALPTGLYGARVLLGQHALELRRLYQLLLRAKDPSELTRWNHRYCGRLMQLNQTFRSLADATENFAQHKEHALEDLRLVTEAHLHHSESLLRKDAPISRQALGIFAGPNKPTESPQRLQIKLKLGDYETCLPADSGFLFALAEACPNKEITAEVASFYRHMAQMAEARQAPTDGSHWYDKRLYHVAENWRACSTYLTQIAKAPQECPPLPVLSHDHDHNA